MKMNKKLIHAATGVFLATEVLIIVLYTFAFGRGFNLNWSISRYMGTDYWSAILFALSNFLVVFLVLKYLLQVRKVHKLSLFWLVLVIAMVVAYVGLSICPIGLFDPSWGHFGIVSTLHHTVSARLPRKPGSRAGFVCGSFPLMRRKHYRISTRAQGFRKAAPGERRP
ncbi:hypothetical protein J6S46_02170 [Candidatus Saccharibacteria bacterium]|nr:hypothetical protein [Candidatus Saccharibacteria bacterium]